MGDLILCLMAICGCSAVLSVVAFIADYVFPRIPFINDWLERHNTSPEIDE